jgi:eukaryotic-like serine/threonine-protein kinase
VGRDSYGADDLRTFASEGNLGAVLLQEENYSGSEKIFRDLLERMRRVAGPDHPRTLLVMGNLALVLKAEQHYAEAEKVFREALELKRKKLGPRFCAKRTRTRKRKR